MEDVSVILRERGDRYGSFDSHARITYGIKGVMQASPNWVGGKLSYSQREALDMVAHKIGRILNGDPNYIDSWRDLCGYSQLIVNELMGTDGASDAKVAKFELGYRGG